MKQLLIVKKSAALNGGVSAPKDLSGMAAGSIGFFALNSLSSWLSAYPTTNFGIALGGGADKVPFVIPEVDLSTLKITKALPKLGVKFSGSVTIPDPVAGKTYTLVLVKTGVVPNERNKWSQAVHVRIGESKTAAQVATALRSGFQAMVDAGSIDVVVGGSSATVTITGKSEGDGWNLIAADDLFGTSVSITAPEPTIGDKKYVEKLAQACAAGKGFNYTDPESQHIYPGYPEAVEDLTPNTSGDAGASTEGYAIYTLRFATGREAGKQTDERIWQYVHIAVPISNSDYSDIDTILTKA